MMEKQNNYALERFKSRRRFSSLKVPGTCELAHWTWDLNIAILWGFQRRELFACIWNKILSGYWDFISNFLHLQTLRTSNVNKGRIQSKHCHIFVVTSFSMAVAGWLYISPHLVFNSVIRLTIHSLACRCEKGFVSCNCSIYVNCNPE